MTHPILALDHGDARVGLACTDPLGIAVHPLVTLPRGEALEGVLELIQSKGIAQLVVGLPLHKDGAMSASAQKARQFVRDLQGHHPQLEVGWVDESFSTREAAERLRSQGIKARQQKEIIDQAAAMEILHRWLEQHGEPLRGMEEVPPPPEERGWRERNGNKAI